MNNNTVTPLDLDTLSTFSRRIRLQLAYDGTAYSGWQKQKDGSAVQNRLENSLRRLFNQEIKTVGSGRTDAGVHALDQNVHFDCPRELGDFDLVYAMNSLLPADIVVKKAWRAPGDFHALSSAQSKIYRYRILNSDTACPLRRNFTWHLRRNLSPEKLQGLSRILIGEHDFKSFQSSGTQVSTTVRRILRAEWQSKGEELEFVIEGNGFLKQMVRNIVGALVEFHDRPAADLLQLIKSMDRKLAPPPAPPQGLYLWKVNYPASIIENSHEIYRRPASSQTP